MLVARIIFFPSLACMAAVTLTGIRLDLAYITQEVEMQPARDVKVEQGGTRILLVFIAASLLLNYEIFLFRMMNTVYKIRYSDPETFSPSKYLTLYNKTLPQKIMTVSLLRMSRTCKRKMHLSPSPSTTTSTR